MTDVQVVIVDEASEGKCQVLAYNLKLVSDEKAISSFHPVQNLDPARAYHD